MTTPAKKLQGKKEQQQDHKKHQEIATGTKKKERLKLILFWILFLVLIAAFAVFRYGYQTFFPNPTILTTEFEEEPFVVSPGGAFVVPFDQRMNAESVEQAILIQPSLPYKAIWDGKTLLLKPTIILTEGDQYHVVLSNDATNLFGQTLLKSYELLYQVGKEPRIVGIFPHEEKLKKDDQIAILFSHSMVSEQEMKAKEQPSFLQLSPVIKGEWIWHNAKTLVFNPKEGFEGSTRYSLQSKNPLQTRDATLIEENIDRTFETERLQLSKEVKEEQELYKVTEPFIVSFNQAVNVKSLQTNGIIRDSTGKKMSNVSIKRKGDESPPSYSIQALRENWLYNEEYTLSLSDELMPEKGNMSFVEATEVHFSTEGLIEFQQRDSESQQDILLIGEDNRLVFALQEDVGDGQLQESLYFVPKQSFELTKNAEREYEIILGSYSQKRENIQLFITENINSEEKQLISNPVNYILKPAPEFNSKIIEKNDALCFYSNNELGDESVLSLANQKLANFKISADLDAEFCPKEEALAYQYFFEKKFLKPDQEHEISVTLKDIYGQTTEESIIAKTTSIQRKDYLLQSSSQIFYQNAQSLSDLHFDYLTANLDLIHAVVCKVTAEQAIKIETTYEEKWYSFEPSPEKCLRYKSISKPISVKWGELQKHTLHLDRMLEDIDSGLYYMYLYAPGLADESGNPIEANLMLQYSHWSMLSKRGESALIWLTERATGQAIPEASLHFYSNDGTVLQVENTDEEGIYFLEKNLLKYEFVIARKGTEELMLSTFAQEGFEPARYDVPFNADESRYYYQFFLEDLNSSDNSITGAFILKQREGKQLTAANASSAIVSLYNEEEQLLWRELRTLDELGTLSFSIRPQYSLLDGVYQLSVCLGLHQGLCHGTNFWVPLHKGKSAQQDQEMNTSSPRRSVSKEPIIIQIDDQEEVKVGDTISYRLSGLSSSFPVLVTGERDGIFFYKVLVTESEEETLSFVIKQQMMPEVMLTVTQFHPEQTRYDMRRLIVTRESRMLEINDPSAEGDKLQFTDVLGNYSESPTLIAFEVENPSTLPEENILDSFYPALGTSIITAAPTLLSSEQKKKHFQVLSNPLSHFQDVFFIQGKFKGIGALEDYGKYDPNQMVYLIAHDEQGNFASGVVGKKQQSEEIKLTTDIPPFIRKGDRLTFEVTLYNSSEENKNLQLLGDAPELQFLSGQNIFLGVPSEKEMKVEIPTQTNTFISGDKITLSWRVSDREGYLTGMTTHLPIAYALSPQQKRKVVTYQANSSSGAIKLPLKTSGQWQRRIVIATSPMSFVLENVKLFFQKEAIRLDEIFFKGAVAANFTDLIKMEFGEENPLHQLINNAEQLSNELSYLNSRQKPDGGWSLEPDAITSDPDITSWIAKALASLQHNGTEVPENMKTKVKQFLKESLNEFVNQRIREGIDPSTLDQASIFKELKILNALSSLTPSGIQYANNWYLLREQLSNESLVLLLLTVEDYRDAQIKGMQFKIEELTQLLKNRREKVQNKIWLTSSSEVDPRINDFVVTSWYLEALVRQASAHTDIPSVISWLVEKKFIQAYQAALHQFVFLESMASYLRIFQEEVTANSITIALSDEKTTTFELDPEQHFSSFSIQDLLTRSESDESISIVTFETDKKQSLFIEVSLEKEQSVAHSLSEGLSIYHDFSNLQVSKGDFISGEITIISPEKYNNVIIIQPQIAGARIFQDEQIESIIDWKTMSIGHQEKWFLLNHLPAGVTRIPFKWEATHMGIFQTAPIYSYVSEQPEIFATSNSELIEIR